MSEQADIYCFLKTQFDCDLSEASFEDACEKLGSDKPKQLICTADSGVIAGRLAERAGLQVIVLPNDIMPNDAWVLMGDYKSVFSKGA